MATCPECNGKGHYWERSVEERGKREKFDCWMCRSSGYVTAQADAEWRRNAVLIEQELQRKISDALDTPKATQQLARDWKSYWDIKKANQNEPSG